ncbi:MAG: ABC transporter ATP-binding protein [Lachnospiraceae bacterium]|nr:ABC transporter ATP-binding protein [Lachnospiraceae bacterium]
MVAIVGRNGAGKSTLFNMLMGITLPQGGTIECDEIDSYHDIGVCIQKQAIDWYLSVEDNVLMGGYLTGMNWRDAHNATVKVLELMDLTQYKSSAPDKLSGGQQQRLQVARALVNNPRIIMLDEPTAGMDYIYSKRLFDYLKERKNAGAIIFVSSHDLSMLEDYCDKLLFLEDGKQIYYGDMNEFLIAGNIKKAVHIDYSGALDDSVLENLKAKGCGIEDNHIEIIDNVDELMPYTIDAICKNATITGIRFEKNRLKNLI